MADPREVDERDLLWERDGADFRVQVVDGNHHSSFDFDDTSFAKVVHWARLQSGTISIGVRTFDERGTQGVLWVASDISSGSS